MTAQVLFVVGPTASGKSEFAVEIAEAIAEAISRAGVGGTSGQSPEIINTDSVQFFAGVDIGAAKPPAELTKRVVHHLIGHVPVGGEYTAGQFRQDALALMAAQELAVRDSEQIWLAVGGSGFYVQALDKGMFDVPSVSPDTRAGLEKEAAIPGGWQTLYRELESRDAVTARRIHPSDRYRILRALEVLRSHNGTLTEIRERFHQAKPAAGPVVNHEPRLKSHKIGFFRDREVLRQAVTLRTQMMLRHGLIDEVVGLRAKLRALSADGSIDTWAPLRSVGYREVQDYLDGKLAREQLESAIVTSTMQLAKRQMTWFKRDPEIRWFDTAAGSAGAIAHALRLFSYFGSEP